MMDYRKRLEKSHMLENRNIQRLNAAKDRALTKLANKAAKDRVVTISQNLVLSNTISLEELSQLDIQNKTMSEICKSITEKFGKTRLEHLDKNTISDLSAMDDYERGELIDLYSITRKQLGKGSSGIIDVVKEKERKQQRENRFSKIEKTMEEEFPELKVHYDAILSSPTRSADHKKWKEEMEIDREKMLEDNKKWKEEMKKEDDEFRKEFGNLSSSEIKHNKKVLEKLSQLLSDSSKGNKIDLEKFGKGLKKIANKGSEEDSK